MVVKQIIFNEESGRLILSDDNNNHYLCDIYGKKKPCFLPDITGCLNNKERLGKSNNNNLSIQVDKPHDEFASQSHNYYLPSNRKFEGYFQFPSPLSAPFINSNLPSGEKNKLLEILKKYFKHEKTLRQFNIPEGENKGVSYFTYPLIKEHSKQDKEDLTNLIDKHFDEYREKNKYQLNLMSSDPVIRSLRIFRRVLEENEDVKVINGRRLPSPSREMKEKFEIMEKIMTKKVNHFDNFEKLNNNNIVNQNKNKNNLLRRSSNFTSSFSPQKKNLYASAENINMYSLPNQNQDLSFLSVESESDRKYSEINNRQIKGVNILRLSLERENKMIDGFIEKPKKEEGIIRKPGNVKLKTSAESYINDIKLLEKGNKR